MEFTYRVSHTENRYHGSYLKGSYLWIVMEYAFRPSLCFYSDLSFTRYCSGGSCSDLVSLGTAKYKSMHPFILEQMKPGVFREEYIAIIVRELLRGLEYLHSEGKLHRDIKGLAKT